MATDDDREGKQGGLGCAIALASFNLITMGAVAASFSSGPYSNFSQQAWYRGGSLCFVLFFAILPIVAVYFTVRRLPKLFPALAVWMLIGLLTFAGYVFMSGGGV